MYRYIQLFLAFSLFCFSCNEKNKAANSDFPERIVSLSPSMTEMAMKVCPEKIVAVSEACDYPSVIDSLPAIATYPQLNLEQLAGLDPDMAIYYDGMISGKAALRMESMGISTFSAKFSSLEELLNGFLQLGKLSGSMDKARSVYDSLSQVKKRLEKNRVKGVKPSVLVIISSKPIFVYGYKTLMTDIIRTAGGINAMGSDIEISYPQISLEYLLEMNPEIIIGYDFESFREKFLIAHPELEVLQAVKNRKIFDINGDWLSRPGPRTFKAVRELQNFIREL